MIDVASLLAILTLFGLEVARSDGPASIFDAEVLPCGSTRVQSSMTCLLAQGNSRRRPAVGSRADNKTKLRYCRSGRARHVLLSSQIVRRTHGTLVVACSKC